MFGFVLVKNDEIVIQYNQNILLILDNSLFDLYCKTTKMLILSA